MKKRRIPVILGIVLTVAILIGIAIPFAGAAGVSIGSGAGLPFGRRGNLSVTVMNPLGEIEPQPNQALAERPADLKGKNLALVYYAKPQNPHAVRAIGEMLEKDFGITATLYSIGNAAGAKPLEYYETLADYDAVVLGVADCTLSAWWAAYHAKMIEGLGTPVVVLTHSAFEKSLAAGAVDNGFTGVRKAVIDSGLYSAGFTMLSTTSNTDFLRETAFVETTDKTPVSVYDQVKTALTQKLSAEESSPAPITARQIAGWGDDISGIEPTDATFTVKGKGEAKAAAAFNDMAMELGFGDGLPMVMPLPELVDEMLAATTRDRSDIIGQIMPRGGLITVEKAAINSVMAGARPEYFPVILAALEAYASSWEDGNLLYHSLTSSENYTMMLLISGPIVEELGISGQWGYLGSGNEANNGIGRAVRLCIRNIGQNRTNETDGTARVGRQNDHAMTVFGEEPRLLPEGWEGQNELLGFGREQSTVTLHGYFAKTMYAAMGGVNAAFNPQNIIRSVRNESSTSIGIATIPRNVADLSRSQLGIKNKSELLDYMLDAGNGNQKLYSRYLLWPVVVGDPDSARLYRDTEGIYGTSAFQSRLITGAVLTEAGRDATTPGAPQTFKAERSGSKATLTWEAPVNDGGSPVTGYQVSCTAGAATGANNPGGAVTIIATLIDVPTAAKNSSIARAPGKFAEVTREAVPAWVDVPAGSMSYTFEGLDENANYTFEVRAINGVRNAVGVTGSGTSQSKNTYALDYSASGRGAWAR